MTVIGIVIGIIILILGLFFISMGISIRYSIFNYMLAPYLFKAGILSDDILDKISDKEIVIFCSDKTLAEAYLSGYKGQAVIYYVKDKLLTKSID